MFNKLDGMVSLAMKIRKSKNTGRNKGSVWPVGTFSACRAVNHRWLISCWWVTGHGLHFYPGSVTGVTV